LTAHDTLRRLRVRGAEITRALLALVVLAALVGGIPVLLWRLAGWPLPHSLPSLTELRAGLTRPLPDELIANTLVTLAWVWWAHFLVCLAAETVSAVRGRMPSRIPGGWLSQALAARLIGAILFLSPSANLVQPAAMATPTPVVGVTVTAPPASHPLLNGAATPGTPSQDAERRPTEHGPVLQRYLVQPKQPGQPHDTLWGIAERHLGDPLRWPEIWELNRGRPQPDPPGGRFTDKDRIWPGQQLLLPPDAVGVPSAERPAPLAPPAAESQAPRQRPTPAPEHHRPSASAAPTAGSPTGSPPQPEPPPTTTPPPLAAHGGQLLRIITSLAGAGLLAVGVVRLLTVLRRRQQRDRRPGRRIPLPTGTTADVEVSLRTTQEPDTARFLDLALRTLAQAVGQAGLPAPEVLAVLITPEHLEVRLADPTDTAPPPFERAAPDRWRLGRAISAGQLEQAAAAAVAPLPALVTAGMVEDTRVLLNLEAPGMVALAGDPIAARALLNACAVELATSVWSDYLDIILVGFGEEFGPLERVRHAATLDEVVAALERRAQRARQLLDIEGHRSALTARMTSQTPDSWTPTVVLCASPPAPAALARIFPTDSQSHGLPLAILAVGELPPPAWRVDLADGNATIDALDLTIRSLQLTTEAYQAITKLLSTAASAQDVEPDAPPYDEIHRPTPAEPPASEVIGRDDTPPERPTTTEPASVVGERLAPATPVEIRILGHVEVHGVPRIQRAKALELIVFLALHPAGVDLERLWEALWPERPLLRPTLHSAASVARAHLGDAPDGTPYLPLAREGLYRLSPLIGLDWTRFQALTQLADQDQGRAIPAVRQALELVRGNPLEGTSPGDYEWAFAHRTEMESAIGDAAEQLARRYLDQHDHAGATWAARRGLLASPYDERLYRQLMRAAYQTGNPPGVDAIMRELLHVLDAEGEPVDDLHPETVELYKKLRGNRLLRT
jgi:DNA-binding SARP family transcriptional activator